MTTIQRFRNANSGLPMLLAALGLMGVLILWACHLGPEDTKDTFDIVADSTWTNCHSVQVILLNDSGQAVDTLFDDSLKTINDLKNLDASKYNGGKGGVTIKGFLPDGGSCFEQTRTFENGGARVEVKPVLDPNVAPTKVEVDPDELVLTLGSPAATLRAVVTPSHANPDMAWSLDASGVVALEGLMGGKGNPARVKPLKAGQGTVTVRSLKDTSKSFTVAVRVNAIGTGGIKIGKDTVVLYVKGDAESLTVSIPTEYAGQKVEWKTADTDIASVDAQGRIKPLKEGETQVRATLTPSGLSDVALVQVRKDVPRLRVISDKGAAVGAEIVFNAVATQEYGTLVSFRWDLLGDGIWDDTSSAGWSGDSVELPAVRQRYNKEGAFIAKFEVLDSEGNVGTAQVALDIGNQAPEITALRADTVISVKDSIPMTATAKDVDGKVVWAGWDYEGDGQFDDTLTGNAAELKVSLGHRYHEAGTYNAVFRAADESGKARLDTAKIKVEFDEPVADAGPDQTVTAGSDVTVSAKGTDKFGPIAKRELKVGDGEFKTLSKQDTVIQAPAQPTVIRIVVRVTDDDGLSDLDTALLTVILSSNADLSGLTLSSGAMVPDFRPNTEHYAARVAFADSMVSLTPTVKDPGTKIVVNAKETPSGKASDPVKITLGSNPSAFQIIVTAADGSQRIYTVSVTRDPNGEATLSKLEAPGFVLSPEFKPVTLEYADTVIHSVANVTFKPTVNSAGATLAFGDSGMTSGTFTAPQPLEFGENVFTFVVTAQDGKSKTTYQVRILRLGRLLVRRKMGGAAPVVVDSFDLAVGSSQPLSGGGYEGWKFLKWTATKGSADFGAADANPTTVTLKSGVAEVEAGFEMLRYTVDLDVKGCGKVEPGVDSTYDYGASPEYRLTAAAGCRILSVKLDGVNEPSALDGIYTFVKIGANHAFAVQFARTFTLDWKVSGKGTVTPTSLTVDSGAPASFKLKPDAGYKVAKDGICIEKTCFNPRPDSTFSVDTVRASRSLTAAFVRAYRMTAAVARGQGDINPKDTLADSAGIMAWRFNPGAAYRLDTLLVNGVPTAQTSPGVLVLNGVLKDTDVKAIFRRQYPIKVEAGPGGTLAPASGLVDSLATASYTATPTTGYRVDSLFLDDKPVDLAAFRDPYGPMSVGIKEVTSSHTVRAVFRRYFEISVKVSGKGSAVPGSARVDSGASQEFTFTPGDVSLYLSSLRDNGDSIPRPDSLNAMTYTVKNVQSARTLEAVYSIRRFTLHITGYNTCIQSAITPVCPPGQICPIPVCFLNGQTSSTAIVDYGSSWRISVSSENASGWPFLNWNVGGVTVAQNPTVVTLTADLNCSARYRPLIIIDPLDPPILQGAAP